MPHILRMHSRPPQGSYPPQTDICRTTSRGASWMNATALDSPVRWGTPMGARQAMLGYQKRSASENFCPV